ncbi:MAG: AMP-binding protein, partial [Planctomycetales bacterium]|nr:AMP-binding protein [Planctomycetales bacterium]
DRNGGWRTVTFSELDQQSTAISSGLQQLGVAPGKRLGLLVPPGIQFVRLVFALFKSGAVTILIDPGMGRRNLIRCLSSVEP